METKIPFNNNFENKFGEYKTKAESRIDRARRLKDNYIYTFNKSNEESRIDCINGQDFAKNRDTRRIGKGDTRGIWFLHDYRDEVSYFKNDPVCLKLTRLHSEITFTPKKNLRWPLFEYAKKIADRKMGKLEYEKFLIFDDEQILAMAEKDLIKLEEQNKLEKGVK